MAKKAAFGVVITLQRLQTGSYVAMTNLKDISGPEVSVDTIDVTTHDSPNAFAEFLAGLRDGGEVTFDVEFDPTSAAHETLYSDVAAGQLHNFRVQLPGFVSTGGGGYVAFAGLFTNIGMQLPVKGSITAPVKIKVSGKPVYTKFA